MSQACGFNLVGSATLIHTLTGNTGSPVTPSGYNINIVGDGTNITVHGDLPSHTLTISSVAGAFVKTLSDNVGTLATPTAAGNIQLVAGTNITTTTSGNSIIIAASPGTLITSYDNVNSTPFVVGSTDSFLSVDCSAVPITVQLPDAPAGYSYWIIKDRTGNASIRNITVTTVTGAVLFDGAATYIMNTNYQAITVMFNGTSYEIW